nr:immunoglobulin heavy chain junction region [Macaca mulatta]
CARGGYSGGWSEFPFDFW